MTKTEEAPQDMDAFAIWRQLYDANEKAWTTALEQAMGTSEFGESSGRLLETMLAAQKSVRDNMRAYLETMNVPTREDIARLGELVVGVEEKSDQIADRLDALEDILQAPSADADKIDRIGKQLETIDRALKSRATDAAKLDRIVKRVDTIERSLRSRATDGAKLDRMAKRLETIERSLKSRGGDVARPAGAQRSTASKPAAAKLATGAKPAVAEAAPPRPTAPVAASSKSTAPARRDVR
jgi:polyhydroxyalkanoic acid synthase PhaR subunit